MLSVGVTKTHSDMAFVSHSPLPRSPRRNERKKSQRKSPQLTSQPTGPEIASNLQGKSFSHPPTNNNKSNPINPIVTSGSLLFNNSKPVSPTLCKVFMKWSLLCERLLYFTYLPLVCRETLHKRKKRESVCVCGGRVVVVTFFSSFCSTSCFSFRRRRRRHLRQQRCGW